MKMPAEKKNTEDQPEKTAKRRPMSLKAAFTTRSFRIGGYSVAACVIVLLIAVAVNIFAGALPSRITQLDVTSNQLFSISDQTEKVLAALEEDITIYWIVQSGEEDDTVGLLLDRYAAMSDHISVLKRDPDVYPTFLQQYGITSVYNNSLLVESGERYRYVDYYDIYSYDYSDYYTTGSYDVSFAGESAVTSAIDYVVSEDLPKLYILSGHGEATMATAFSDAVTDANIETEALSLLTVEEVPDDAAAILIYAPQSDISEEEKDVLLAYLQGGGNLILLSEPQEDGSLENLEALMAGYGVTAADGIVIEGNQNYYAWGTPYYLLPEIEDHAITSPLSENGYYVLLPIAQGLMVDDELPDGVTVTELLTTSDSAFSKTAGYSLTTYEKEDGDIDGPFALAVAITDAVDDDTESKIVWVSSSYLLDEQTNMEVSGGNEDLFLNALSWTCGQSESSISIHAKSLSYEYVTMSSGMAAIIIFCVIGLIPLAYLGIGIGTVVRRKRR